MFKAKIKKIFYIIFVFVGNTFFNKNILLNIVSTKFLFKSDLAVIFLQPSKNYNDSMRVFYNSLRTAGFAIRLNQLTIRLVNYKVVRAVDRVFFYYLYNEYLFGWHAHFYNRYYFRKHVSHTSLATSVRALSALASKHNKYLTSINFGLKAFWRGLRFWSLSIILFSLIMYSFMVFKFVPLAKILFQWFSIVMFVYWLISGFVFFIKKYQTSKFTSVIQRFWRRSYILFWLIETSVFAAFLYLTFNASQEPFYMHDQIAAFKTHFVSWRLVLLKASIVAFLILLMYTCLLALRWNIFTKSSLWFFFITLILTYVVWLEFYQFFHIISYYSGLAWIFEFDERIWVLDIDTRRTRVVNNYVALCLMAKFWHLIFIYIFWIFFILRINELQRIRYPLFVANLQNFIILYIMCWLYMYPWLKFFGRKYMDYTYTWFFFNSRKLGTRVFFVDLKLYIFKLISTLTSVIESQLHHKQLFVHTSFFYWLITTSTYGFSANSKHYIRDMILTSLVVI